MAVVAEQAGEHEMVGDQPAPGTAVGPANRHRKACKRSGDPKFAHRAPARRPCRSPCAFQARERLPWRKRLWARWHLAARKVPRRSGVVPTFGEKKPEFTRRVRAPWY